MATHEVLSFTEGLRKKTTLKFITSSNHVLNYSERHPSIDPLLKTILRTYGGLFENFVTINEYNIGKKLNLPYSIVVEKIKSLEKDGLVKYAPASNTATLQFLVPREDERTINHIAKSIEQLQKNKEFKAKSLLQFINNNQTCRSKQLLAYFDETEEKDCGICDVCLTKKGSLKKTTTNLHEKIMQLLEDKKALSSREIVSTLRENKIATLNTLTALLEDNHITVTKENKYALTKNTSKSTI